MINKQKLADKKCNKCVIQIPFQTNIRLRYR